MADLHERLERLAEDAPRSVTSSDLWRRGRRYGRSKMLGQVVAGVSCLALVWAVGSTFLDLTPDQQRVGADPAAKTWLPDELFTPDPWLRSTTDRDGPPGRLIAIVPGEHKTLFSGEDGFYGISAETGDYRFLNLPDLPSLATVSLSPDGTKLAYWLAKTQVSEFVNGFAVYDTISGELDRNPIESRFGLVADGFGWTKDSVWAQYSELTELPTKNGWSADQAPVLTRNLVDGTTRTEGVGYVDLSSATSGGAGLVSNSRKGFKVVKPNDPNVRTRYESTIQVDPSPFLTPEGTRVAGLTSTNRVGDEGEPLVVGTIPASGNRVVMTPVAGVKVFQVFGWRDETHLLGISGRSPILQSIDVDRGTMTPAVNLGDSWGGVRFANDLLGSPIRAGVEPEAPPNPWILIGVAGAAAALGLWIWRRRVRV